VVSDTPSDRHHTVRLRQTESTDTSQPGLPARTSLLRNPRSSSIVRSRKPAWRALSRPWARVAVTSAESV
jgi:hypothetical protein